MKINTSDIKRIMLNNGIPYSAKMELAAQQIVDAIPDAQVNVPSADCTHEHTEFKQIRCNVCSDCGNIVEVDV